ncbi:hypothetical protein B0H13DRAFT_1879258 [Mycena leptocephala]|nr:hypothetical protein B0H13DRAFT_1879258 [Mycena leptocephala]
MNHAFPGPGCGSSAKRNHTTSLVPAPPTPTYLSTTAPTCTQITWGSRRAASKLLGWGTAVPPPLAGWLDVPVQVQYKSSQVKVSKPTATSSHWDSDSGYMRQRFTVLFVQFCIIKSPNSPSLSSLPPSLPPPAHVPPSVSGDGKWEPPAYSKGCAGLGRIGSFEVALTVPKSGHWRLNGYARDLKESTISNMPVGIKQQTRNSIFVTDPSLFDGFKRLSAELRRLRITAYINTYMSRTPRSSIKMPPQPTVTQIRLNNITTCLTISANTARILASSLKSPFLEAIRNTSQSLLKNMQTVRRNKNDCAQLLEQTYELLNAILMVHINSPTGGELPPSVLAHIGKFTETLHKIHTFVEAQQNSSKLKNFFHQGEMSTLLKDCKAGLQQGFEIFQVPMVDHMKDIAQMQADAEKQQKEVLDMIEALSDTTSSDRASSISGLYSGSHNSSNSISMLPSQPKIFHGRDSELSNILQLFSQGTPRIAILGAGGMGKTSLARAVIHHTGITERYNQHRFFITCDLAATQVELAALIGAHVGLKPGKDLTHPVIQYFSSSSYCLLILDNLETLWEPAESRGKIEEFLSLLTGVDHLALLEVDKVLSLTDNMPLAISLIAHLVDSEGCSHVLSHWEEEKTSLMSDGYDRTSNLDLSISLSLSSPRLNPHSKNLLSLLSMLPDGLSDVELMQSKLPLDNILGCKAALVRTSLAYSDENKRLKALVPIREYMQKIQPPGDYLIQPLLKHFQELLEFYMEYRGNQSSSSTVARVSSNYSNIQNVLQNGLQQGHPDLVNSIYCACYLNNFSQAMRRGGIPWIQEIHIVLPHPCDHHLEAYLIIEQVNSRVYSISNLETLAYNVLEHFEEFDDIDLKCRFYNVLATYYRKEGDISSTKKFCEAAVSLALSTGNTKWHSQGLRNLAWVEWNIGDYSAAQKHAKEAQRLAIISADLYREAQALNIEATCCYTLGNHIKAMSLCIRARDLLGLCGMSHGALDYNIMNTQAEIHRLKSEYAEARSIQIGILEGSTQDPRRYGWALLNVAEIDVLIGAPKDEVQKNCDRARKMLDPADLYLREGNSLAAKTIFKRCLKETLEYSQIQTYCLERLGNTSYWGDLDGMSSWTAIYLVNSLQRKEKLGIYKAFQFLGNIFLLQNDEHTAISLFTVALEGFTQMDVHRSRAECMLQLGDISKGHGCPLKAMEFWERAGPLFERSSQVKQVQHIKERLAGINEDVLEQHKKNLAHLAELNALAGTMEELEDDLSDIEDRDKM